MEEFLLNLCYRSPFQLLSVEFDMKILKMALVICSVLTLNSTLYARDLPDIIKKGVIRMAADKTLEPWIYEDVKTGNYTGFEYEYAEYLAKELSPNLKVEVVNGEWAKLPQDVRAQKADFVLNAWFRPKDYEIPETDKWTQCYYQTGFSIMYDSKEASIPNMETLQTPDTVIGIYPDPAPIKILEKYGITEVKKSKEHEEYKNYIVNDVVDYFFFDAPAAQYQAKISNDLIKATPSIPGTEDCYAIMVRSQSPLLLKALNDAIQKLEAKKQMASITEKYGID